jgi:hypothetical protein
MATDFCCSIKRDKTHYSTLKEYKHFDLWNKGFVATAHMHHTHVVLDESYVPSNKVEKAVFTEIQAFMYAVLQEHLKTNKRHSLVSQYEKTRDAHRFFRDLVKHALSSTAAQLSGDIMLQYITTTRYPGTTRGTSHCFVSHWKEQVIKYE